MITETYQVGEFLVETYDNPSVNLSPSDQERLVQEFTPVASGGFDKHEFNEDVVRRHFLNTSTTVVIRERTGRVAGFAGSSVFDLDDDTVIYLQGGTIAKSCRARNLYGIAIGARIMADIRKVKKDYVNNNKVLIAGRTQNPITYKLLHRKLRIFPYPNGYIHNDLKNKAKKIALKIYEEFSDFQSSQGCIFNTNSFVSKRSFGSVSDGKESGYSLYGDKIPFCNDDETINDYMLKSLDWNNGDALIMVGYYCQQDVLSLLHTQQVELNPSIAA